MQYLLVYFLILSTVAAIAVLPHVIGQPGRRNGRRVQAVIPADPLDQAVQSAPARPVMAEVD